MFSFYVAHKSLRMVYTFKVYTIKHNLYLTKTYFLYMEYAFGTIH